MSSRTDSFMRVGLLAPFLVSLWVIRISDSLQIIKDTDPFLLFLSQCHPDNSGGTVLCSRMGVNTKRNESTHEC